MSLHKRALLLFLETRLFSIQIRIFITKTAHYVLVYKAVLTVFMLYDYDKNIDIILKGVSF